MLLCEKWRKKMRKNLIVGLLSLAMLVISIFFVTAIVSDKNQNDIKEITTQGCSCGCNVTGGGNCGIEGCSCQKTTCDRNCGGSCGGTCASKTCGCSK
jgi:hypothetical protein